MKARNREDVKIDTKHLVLVVMLTILSIPSLIEIDKIVGDNYTLECCVKRTPLFLMTVSFFILITAISIILLYKKSRRRMLNYESEKTS